MNALSGPFFNRYWYANNNPYKFTDPDGRIVETLWDAANVVIGVASAYSNFSQSNVGAGLVDVGGVVVDVEAALIPVVPGGAGTAIKAARGAEKIADKVVDTARAARPAEGASMSTNEALDRFVVLGRWISECF